ncbi:hypothetical protein OfM1_02240 [Lactovum odontotermitis]
MDILQNQNNGSKVFEKLGVELPPENLKLKKVESPAVSENNLRLKKPPVDLPAEAKIEKRPKDKIKKKK